MFNILGGVEIDASDLSELPAFARLELSDTNPKLIVAQAKQEISKVIHLLE